MHRLQSAVLFLIAALMVPLAAPTAGSCQTNDWAGDPSLGQPSGMPISQSGSPDFAQRSSVPGPPLQQQQGSRPASWPGAPVDTSGISWGKPPTPGVEMIPCEGATIVAKVGNEVILEREIMATIKQMNQWIDDKKNSIPASASLQDRDALLEKLEAERTRQLQRAIDERVEVKLIYQEIAKTVPAEGLTKFRKDLENAFEETQVESLIIRAGVNTRAELDQKLLRELGTSLDREKRKWVESNAVGSWLREKNKTDKEVTPDQLLTYYQQHLDAFTTPARAKYEEMMVRFSKYPSKQAALEAISQMGREVWNGAPFAEVAKAKSDGATSNEGGQRPWTTPGSLASDALDRAVFTQPVGQLGEIVESPIGFHILRVTQRDDAVTTPFRDAQVEIQKKILEDREKKQRQDYMASLKAKTPIWTMFDGDISDPRLSRRPGEPIR
jgi:parvulin-like peptidyl-prolyl isomerase